MGRQVGVVAAWIVEQASTVVTSCVWLARDGGVVGRRRRRHGLLDIVQSVVYIHVVLRLHLESLGAVLHAVEVEVVEDTVDHVYVQLDYRALEASLLRVQGVVLVKNRAGVEELLAVGQFIAQRWVVDTVHVHRQVSSIGEHGVADSQSLELVLHQLLLGLL